MNFFQSAWEKAKMLSKPKKTIIVVIAFILVGKGIQGPEIYLNNSSLKQLNHHTKLEFHWTTISAEQLQVLQDYAKKEQIKLLYTVHGLGRRKSTIYQLIECIEPSPEYQTASSQYVIGDYCPVSKNNE